MDRQTIPGRSPGRGFFLTLRREPFDLGNFARPGYYWNYESAKFNDLYTRYKTTARAQDRTKLLGDIQRLVSDDAVHAYLYQPQWVTVANKNIKGLWKDMPIFVNDISALSWA